MRDIEFTFKGLLIKLSLALSDLICFNAALALAILLINSFLVIFCQISLPSI